MLAAVVVRGAGDDGDVGLGFGLVIEPDRSFRAHVPPWPEQRLQRSCRLHDRGVVRCALRLGDHELAADELDPLILVQHTELDHAVVLGPGEATRFRVIRRHRGHRIGGPRTGQRRSLDTAAGDGPRR